jgi:endo-alpha-1,4-polygalactosaminidase (GH114 family)
MTRAGRTAWLGLWLAALPAAGCGDDDATDVADSSGEDATAEDAPGDLPPDVPDDRPDVADDDAAPDAPDDGPADPGDVPEDRPEADDSADGPDVPPGIWRPAPGTSWQWQLTDTIDDSLDVEMYDIDLVEAPQETIDALRARGVAVVCYFSAGSREAWRGDAGDFPAAAVGDPLDGWPDERWLDVRDGGVRDVMRARLDLAVAKRCDGVEPDNVDGYANDNGLDLTAGDQLDYNGFLAAEAHARGLSVGLKNDLDQVEALEPAFDWALNEECLAYDECDLLAPFLAAGKAVFHVEYVDAEEDGPALIDEICADPAIEGFSTLVKTWDLTAYRLACE